jgi:hypothetical protein
MSSEQHTLRWFFTSLGLAVLAILVLLAVGDVYAGKTGGAEFGATIDGEPAISQLQQQESGADVRNASVGLGLVAVGVLVLTYFYWRHTGLVGRRRALAKQEKEIAAIRQIDHLLDPNWQPPSTASLSAEFRTGAQNG